MCAPLIQIIPENWRLIWVTPSLGGWYQIYLPQQDVNDRIASVWVTWSSEDDDGHINGTHKLNYPRGNKKPPPMTFKEDGKSLQIYVSGRTQILGSELWVEERQSPSSINKNQNFILLQFMETSFLIFLCKTTACLPAWPHDSRHRWTRVRQDDDVLERNLQSGRIVLFLFRLSPSNESSDLYI